MMNKTAKIEPKVYRLINVNYFFSNMRGKYAKNVWRRQSKSEQSIGRTNKLGKARYSLMRNKMIECHRLANKEAMKKCL